MEPIKEDTQFPISTDKGSEKQSLIAVSLQKLWNGFIVLKSTSVTHAI
jgi:hypothetical protein